MTKWLPTIFTMMAVSAVCWRDPWYILVPTVTVAGIAGWFLDQMLDHVMSKYLVPPRLDLPLIPSGRATVVLTLQSILEESPILPVPAGTVFTDIYGKFHFRLLHTTVARYDIATVAIADAVDPGSDFNIPAYTLSVSNFRPDAIVVTQHIPATGGAKTLETPYSSVPDPDPDPLTLWDHLKES